MDKRFRQRERVKTRNDIDKIFSTGTRCTRGCLTVIVLRNDLGYSRLGIGVSSKLCCAVRRNRLKRLVREAYRLNKPSIPTGLDIFVLPKETDAAFDEIERDLVEAAGKACEKLEKREGQNQ
jgi:ribonuclease P protein component